MPVLIQIDGYDPVAGAAVTLRAASVDDERVCHLDGQVWWPALASLPPLREVRFDGGFGGAIETPSSEFELTTEPWPLFARYALADARVRIWVGAAGAAWSAWALRFDGRVTAQPAVANGRAQLAIAVDDRWLDTPLLVPYAGTGGAEGDASLKGQPKPLALGAPRYVPGVMFDAINNVIQLSGYGAIENVETAMERAVRFGASIGDYPNYGALVAAPIPAGRWGTCKLAGMVRHGAPPVGLLSYHIKGDKAGPDGWVRLPGSLIRRIALLAGGTGRIDEAALTALDVARPWPLSRYQADQITARELIQRIAASVNAVARVSWLGKLVVDPVDFSAPTMELDATGAALPPVASVEQAAVDAPWWRLAIGAEPTWAVHGLADIAFTATLVDRGDYVAGETYREGHFVQDQGSSWLYINPAPSSGNAPPTLPTTSDAWWRVMARGGASAIVAFLTNETVSVPATSAGAVTDTAGAGGQMRVFLGTTEITAQCTFSAVSFAGGGYSPSDFGPTSDWVINADGSYALTATPAWTGDSGWFLIRATHAASGTVIDKVFTATKAKGGADGANAKTLIVLADRQTIAYDGAGAATPAVQTITFSTNKQNTSATVTWSVTDAAGVARTPVTTYLSAATGDSVTMTEAQFAAARNATAGVIVTGSLSDGGTITDKISVVRVQGGAAGAAGADGPQGPTGPAGANAIVAFLTNETVSVPATSAGGVTSTAGAGGQMRVFLGTTEVTAGCTFTAVGFGSGGYAPSDFGPTTDWVINADGSYALTATPSWSADAGWFLIRATHAASGAVIDKIFTVTKAKGGATGANAKTLIVLADRQTIAYDGAGAATPSVQTTTFSTNKQNTSATVNWSITDAAGVARTPVTTYLSAATGDSVTMTEAQFAAARNGTAGVIVTGSLSDGGTITDKISVVRVQGGAAGISPIAVSVDPPSLTIACSYDGTPKGGELPASFAFTAIKGAAGVAIDTLAISSSGGCTVAVSGSAVNLTAISAASGGFIANVTAGGQTVPVAVNFTTTKDAPPASTTVTDTSTTNVTSTTYAVIGGELTVKASATGKLRVKLAASYKTLTSGPAATTLVGKLQLKPSAGAYADVSGSEVTGSQSQTTSLGDGGPPYKTFSGGLDTGWINLTGLTASGDYVLRRQARKTTGSDNTSSCSLTIAAEPVA